MTKVMSKDKVMLYTDTYVNNGLNKTKAYMNTMKVDYKQANAHCTEFHNRVVNSGKIPKEYFNENTVKRDIKRVKKLVLKAKDYSNYLRATELESKILGLQVDKSESKVKITNTEEDNTRKGILDKILAGKDLQ